MEPESAVPPSSKILTTVLVPAFNEEEGLPIVLRKICQHIDSSFEILVVDDGSTDGTAKVASQFPCRVVSYPVNRGKGEAMKTGIAHAQGENIIFIDADDTYPTEIIPKMAAALDSYDMVVASRVDGRENIPAFNRVGNAIFRNSIRYLYGFKPYDPLTGFYGIKKTHLQKMELVSSGFGIESEIAIKGARMGLRMHDIPIGYRPRVGEAKLHGLKDGYRIFRTILGHLALFNPTFTFILPGSLLLLMGLIGMGLALAKGTTPSYVLALGGMAAMAGFYLGLLGSALHLYAVARQLRKPSSLSRLFSRQGTEKTLTSLGTILFRGLGSSKAGEERLNQAEMHGWFRS